MIFQSKKFENRNRFKNKNSFKKNLMAENETQKNLILKSKIQEIGINSGTK